MHVGSHDFQLLMLGRAHYGALALHNSSSAAGTTPCYSLTTNLQDLIWWFGLLALTCTLSGVVLYFA